MENFVPHQNGERVVLVSVAVQILEDLDAEEFQLLAESAALMSKKRCPICETAILS